MNCIFFLPTFFFSLARRIAFLLISHSDSGVACSKLSARLLCNLIILIRIGILCFAEHVATNRQSDASTHCAKVVGMLRR